MAAGTFVHALLKIIAAAPLLVGCSVEVEVPWLPASSDLEVGTGEAEFAPLAEESELPVVLGPQGGYHVVGNVRVRGIFPPDPIGNEGYPIDFWLMAEGGAMISLDTGPIPARLQRQPDGTY